MIIKKAYFGIDSLVGAGAHHTHPILVPKRLEKCIGGGDGNESRYWPWYREIRGFIPQ